MQEKGTVYYDFDKGCREQTMNDHAEYEFYRGCEVLSDKLINVPNKRIPEAIAKLQDIVSGGDGDMNWSRKELKAVITPLESGLCKYTFRDRRTPPSKKEVEKWLHKAFWDSFIISTAICCGIIVMNS